MKSLTLKRNQKFLNLLHIDTTESFELQPLVLYEGCYQSSSLVISYTGAERRFVR